MQSGENIFGQGASMKILDNGVRIGTLSKKIVAENSKNSYTFLCMQTLIDNQSLSVCTLYPPPTLCLQVQPSATLTLKSAQYFLYRRNALKSKSLKSSSCIPSLFSVFLTSVLEARCQLTLRNIFYFFPSFKSNVALWLYGIVSLKRGFSF